MSIAQLTGIIYPDRTFTIGKIPAEKKGIEEKRYDRAYEAQWDSYYEVTKTYDGITTQEVRFFQGTTIEVCSSNVRNHHQDQFDEDKQRGKYGGKGITSYGRKVVSNIPIVVERRYGKARLALGTCTLPNFRKSILQVLCINWGELTRRFFQKFKRIGKKRNFPADYCSCTEIQEKRYSQSGVPVLHVHFLYVCKPNARGCDFYLTPDQFRSMWIEAIFEILRAKNLQAGEDICYSNCFHCSVIKKSASGYLGKYLSKGTKAAQKIIEQGDEDLLPSQWWSASMQWKKLFKDSLIRMDAETCESFFYFLEYYLHEGIIVWAKFVTVQLEEDREYTVGLVGRLSYLVDKKLRE